MMSEHDPKNNLMAGKAFLQHARLGTRFTEWSKPAAMRPKQRLSSLENGTVYVRNAKS
jgi:hypothetical protein